MGTKIQLDESGSMIYYKLRSYHENDTSDNWFVSHHIPLLCIDTITMNYKDSSITFFVKENRISTFQGGFRAAKNNKVSMQMKLPRVRNLSGQLLGHIRAYQQENKKNKPATARQQWGRPCMIISISGYIIQQRLKNC
ncbi:MAG: hypothetical protein IPH18_11525 [Chitinophagaceae bacterium]|nr:hypothetical protein [Chitinophagaceae bacterium]